LAQENNSMSQRTTPRHAGQPIHVHIENVSTYHKHVQITPRWFQEAAERHPETARRVRATISWDYKNFDEQMKTAEVLVFMGIDFKPGDFARRAPNLKWIQMTSAGVEHIMPFDWLPAHVILTNNSGVHAEQHGEFALTAILMLNHNVPAMVSNQRESRWHTIFGSPLRGKTLAVVGVGHIGGHAARLAKQLGMTVLGVRRSGKVHRYVDEMFKPDALGSVLPRADFVLVTLPHTGETGRMIGRGAFERMKPGAGFANLGRGATVDYDVMREFLDSGRLSGAVLDAYEEEPLSASSPLWQTRNLILSPHCSSSDVDKYVPQTLDLTFENLERYMAGRPLLNRINRKLGY
jgi:phosphoglycerate dehydrogenase-like enzyme